MRRPSSLLSVLALVLVASLGLGCAQLPGMLFEHPAPALHAEGPGTLFESAEAAAVDALTYAYLQAREAGDTERMRGGTIFAVGEGFSYADIHVASSITGYRVGYSLHPQDVARFQMYPLVDDHDVNRVNERASLADRRSIRVTDPLHRPLYVLHPSLAIRAYRAGNRSSVLVAQLGSAREPSLYAGNSAPPRAADSGFAR
jgi:hypothetical protein